MTINGSNGNDTINGGAQADRIRGLNGHLKGIRFNGMKFQGTTMQATKLQGMELQNLKVEGGQLVAVTRVAAE
jgi:Ca2+-binding RTX toxin-like protein